MGVAAPPGCAPTGHEHESDVNDAISLRTRGRSRKSTAASVRSGPVSSASKEEASGAAAKAIAEEDLSEENWSFQRLAHTVSTLVTEYTRFQAAQQQQEAPPAGPKDRKAGKVASSSRLPRDQDDEAAEVNDPYDFTTGRRGEDTVGQALLGLHAYLMQFRDDSWLHINSGQTVGNSYISSGSESPSSSPSTCGAAPAGDLCRICLGHFKDTEALTKLPCRHLFHG